MNIIGALIIIFGVAIFVSLLTYNNLVEITNHTLAITIQTIFIGILVIISTVSIIVNQQPIKLFESLLILIASYFGAININNDSNTNHIYL